MLYYVVFVFLSLCHIVYCADGFDFGDVLALLLVMGLSIVGICACLGCYARRRAGGLDSL